LDVLHVQMPYSPVYAARVISCLPKSTAVVGTFHILPYGKIAFHGTKVLSQLLKPSLKRFDKFICVSEANQKFFKKIFKLDSIVVPNMVNVDEFRPKQKIIQKNDRPTILYSGRLTERKGCRYLLLAARQIKKIDPSLDFLIRFAGLGDQKSKLEKMTSQLGLQNNVKFSGFLSDEDKVNYMQSADIACFPAYSGESFGIVLLEAMAAKSGVVLAGDNPGYRTVLGSVPESIIDPKDSDQFAKTLIKFIKDKKYRDQVRTRQQGIIDDFDYKNVGSRVQDIYIDCINLRNRA
jgi:phosphatidylinositol alpha-mannosyltransferase